MRNDSMMPPNIEVEEVDDFNFMKRVEGHKRETIRKSDGRTMDI